MSGYEYMGKKPFSNVYYTGIVRDKQRRKMSKSLGNSPDPIELIEKYGADGVRMGMLLCSPAGNDILFDESQVEQGRNFGNKLWNAFRLLKGWEVKPDSEFSEEILMTNKLSIEWFEGKFHESLSDIESKYTGYKLSEALMTMYKLIWDDFCAWYLEMIKPEYGKPIDESTYEATVRFFEQLMKVLHPVMPFITEEIWQSFTDRYKGESICLSQYPISSEFDATMLDEFKHFKEIVILIREIRSTNNLKQKNLLNAVVLTNSIDLYSKPFVDLVSKMGNVQLSINVPINKFTNDFRIPIQGVKRLLNNNDTIEIYFPLVEDIQAIKERDIEELKYYEGLFELVNKKLSNPNFVLKAKSELVEKERKILNDTNEKIRILKENINRIDSIGIND
jgi:valyl-tRNA synthetase